VLYSFKSISCLLSRSSSFYFPSLLSYSSRVYLSSFLSLSRLYFLLYPHLLPICLFSSFVLSSSLPSCLSISCSEPVFVNLLRNPGIVSQPGVTVRQPYLSYRPARLHRLAESISRNRFLGSINVYKFGLGPDSPPFSSFYPYCRHRELGASVPPCLSEISDGGGGERGGGGVKVNE
jgi:hypothetical protein